MKEQISILNRTSTDLTRRDFVKRAMGTILAAPALPSIVAPAPPKTLGVDMVAPGSVDPSIWVEYSNEDWVYLPRLASDDLIASIVDRLRIPATLLASPPTTRDTSPAVGSSWGKPGDSSDMASCTLSNKNPGDLT